MSIAGTDDRAPGAGKGTQGALIAAHFGIPRISDW
jgi:adenylate kinase family enzyme